MHLGDLGEVLTLLDTGADVSVVPLSLVKKKNLISRIDQRNLTQICCFAGKPYQTLGTLKVKLKEGDVKCKVHLHVVDMHTETILGIAAIRKLGATWNFESDIVTIGGVPKPVICRVSKEKLHPSPSWMGQMTCSADCVSHNVGV